MGLIKMGKFTRAKDLTNLIRICEQRLPVSVHVYNQLITNDRFDLEVYYSGSGVNEEDTWILVKWLRPDWNYFISVCSPLSAAEYDPSCFEFRDALAHSGVIDWNIHSFITPIDKLSAKMLLNVYVDHVIPVWTVRTTQMYYMKPELALKLNPTTQDPNVRLGPLTVEQGVDFMVDSWHFRYICSREKVCDVVRKLIENSVTGGVYVKDANGKEELACGAVYSGSGELCMLHTNPNHRRKGYARLIIRYVFKEMAKIGLHGCILGELGNDAAIKLYSGIEGIEPVQKFIFMCCEPMAK